MRIEYELSVADLTAFSRHARKHSSIVRRAYWQLCLGPPLGFVFAGIIAFLSSDSITVVGFFASTIPLAIFLGVYVFMYGYMYDRSLPKRIEENASRKIGSLGSHVLNIDETGILEKTERGERRVYWKYIDVVQDTSEYYFVYINPVEAVIVPKRALSNSEVTKDFESYIHRAGKAA